MTHKNRINATFFTDLPLPFPTNTKYFSIESALSSFDNKYNKVYNKLIVGEIQNKIANKIFKNKNKSDNDFLFAKKEETSADVLCNENDNWSDLLSGMSYCNDKEEVANTLSDNKEKEQCNVNSNEIDEQIVIQRRRKKNVKRKQKTVKYDESEEENIFEQNIEEETLEYLKFKYGQENNKIEESAEKEYKEKTKKLKLSKNGRYE
ncbi:hypothetical protein BDAP_000928 [Binucleata daphniae]